MDTEELHEIAFHQKHGRPETTKGPYYHKTWWEAYKGAVKGTLGGIIAGGAVGAIVGGAVLGALSLGSLLTANMAIPILATTTLFGMYEGKEKFEKVGITTGAIAAANETAEVRMKEYVRSKFTDITNEIRELKAAIAGKKDVASLKTDVAAPDNAPIFDESDFRSTHMSANSPKDKGKFVFWNVAGIGAVIGAGVATITSLALGDEIAEAAKHLLGNSIEGLSTAAISTTFVAGSSALGATFGINREMFRKIFDVTDCWFMGITNGPCSVQDISKAHGEAPPQLPAHQPPQSLLSTRSLAEQPAYVRPSRIIPDSSIAHQQGIPSADIILTEKAKHALLGIDPTTAIRH